MNMELILLETTMGMHRCSLSELTCTSMRLIVSAQHAGRQQFAGPTGRLKELIELKKSPPQDL